MVLSDKGRKKLSDLAKSRERDKSGRFVRMGNKYVYEMHYILRGASHKTSTQDKWKHVRVTKYSREHFEKRDFQRLADARKPPDYAIPNGNRERFETYECLSYTRKQAEREDIDDMRTHYEEYAGKGGGLRDT